ncbi:molybdopterin-guanine dinucleotide biosynthesis protein A [Amorphus orientalis]|uniref:Molybdopterin-guanine dinucleotide biosynthesis protein A n=1 Tax=Amorphus orientalis TaxID=649198 RepID=A0AAE3VPJ9_9HYPH|nr:molybdopterin-guanine dinucleotide biosynthesis protein A [Amorphus orientalis]
MRLSGTPLLDHVLARLRPQADPIALNADADDPRLRTYALPILSDSTADRRGPLAGLAAALRWARDSLQCDRVALVPVDAPFLPTDCLERLLAGGSAISIAASGGRVHPVVGCFSTTLLDDLEDHLGRAERTSVMAWVDRHAPDIVVFDPVRIGSRDVDPFFNINTQDDLAAAAAILAADPSAAAPLSGRGR